ncbi:MAG: hypothetical protein ACI8RP_001865, partial [Urechidicola sp.]
MITLHSNLMGPRTKRDIMRILPFGLIWMVFTII